MRIPLIFLWALAGWCATLVLVVLQLPPGLDGTPDPPPRPNWGLYRLIGVIGGIVGGLVFTQVFSDPVSRLTAGPGPEPWMGGISAAATTVGAFIGAGLLVDLYGLVRGGRATRG